MMSELSDWALVVARIFLATLFLIFGWRKVRDLSGTVSQMVGDGVPVPRVAAAAAIFMELPVALAVALGALTRPAAVLMALYTLGTSLIEHRYWAMTGAAKLGAMEQFYKNLSIAAGFMLLFVAGPGRYSLDALSGLGAP